MENTMSDYGLWGLVVINSAIFIIFAFSFTKPKTRKDWRSFSAFSAFIVALFVEMYGFQLTIYVLSGWLNTKYPNVDFLSHENGHLWHTIMGFEGNAHVDPFHIASMVLILFGFIVLSKAWPVLYQAQKFGTLASTGIYSKIRHPQYVGFVLIMFGFLLQWPTIPTLIMFPVLVVMYWRLSMKEERDTHEAFGDEYMLYKERVPAIFPTIFRKRDA